MYTHILTMGTHTLVKHTGSFINFLKSKFEFYVTFEFHHFEIMEKGVKVVVFLCCLFGMKSTAAAAFVVVTLPALATDTI